MIDEQRVSALIDLYEETRKARPETVGDMGRFVQSGEALDAALSRIVELENSSSAISDDPQA